jgi:hypothetical protein
MRQSLQFFYFAQHRISLNVGRERWVASTQRAASSSGFSFYMMGNQSELIATLEE